MTTPPRLMLEIGVEGDRFNPHAENPGCANAGCVPADAPVPETPSVLIDLLVRRIPGVPAATPTPAPLDVPTIRLSMSAAVGCPRVLPAAAPGPATSAPLSLLPCPFCGEGEPHGAVDNLLRHAAIQCLWCGARGPLSSADGTYHDRVREAALEWNTRTPLPEVQRLREAAQAVVEAWATEYRFHADDGCPMCTVIQALEAALREREAPEEEKTDVCL